MVAEQVAGRGHGLFGGVHPVLQPHPGAEVRAVPGGDVVGGGDARGGPAMGVALDAVAQAQAGAGQPAAEAAPTARTTTSAGSIAVGQFHPGDPAARIV